MKVKLVAIELDTSIQCRAAIGTGVVNEYAERMNAGDTFPPVELYGTTKQSWIADGWHRVLAARQLGEDEIVATVHPGGRVDALKAALCANAVHGHRRTNADKRRAVEIALREFPKLSSRAIAEMCGVSDMFVGNIRAEQVQTDCTCSTQRTTGRDGKQHPAKKKSSRKSKKGSAAEAEPASADNSTLRPLDPPSDGLRLAHMAIMDLREIRPDDTEREQAFTLVEEWLHENR